MPDSATGKPAKPAKPEDATKGEGTKLENKLDQNDSVKDQLNSDK
jgi:hypothetical protein